MSPLRIRPYQAADRDAVVSLWKDCGLVVPQNDPHRDIARKLSVNSKGFLVGESDDRIVATCMAGYEGHRGWINYLAVAPECQRRGFARQIMEAAEALLRDAGCPKINLQVRSSNVAVIDFYKAIGFAEDSVLSFGKRLVRDDEPQAANVPEDTAVLPDPPAEYSACMPRFAEAASLVSVGLDFNGRDALLEPTTAVQWEQMKSAASGEGLELLLISGFRSRAYQASIITRKLAVGQPFEEILRVSAYPGFSEHHAGRAIDIGCRGCTELTGAFEDTAEFRWLSANAHRFGFVLSYPRGNPHGILYEPWHWARREPISTAPRNVGVSSRIELVPCDALYAAALFEAAVESRAEISRWMPWCHEGYSIEDALNWTYPQPAAWAAGSGYEFVIIDRESKKLLGACGINFLNAPNRYANLGYWIRSSQTGKGYASEAAKLAADFAFTELGLSRVEIVAAVGNLASQRVAEKAGAMREGVLRNRLVVGDTTLDAVMFSLVPNA